MEDGLKCFLTDGSYFLGRMEITDSEIIIYKKNWWICVLLGTVGYAISTGKEYERFNISDISDAARESFRLNRNAYHVTLKHDRGEFMFIFDHPRLTIGYLDAMILEAQ